MRGGFVVPCLLEIKKARSLKGLQRTAVNHEVLLYFSISASSQPGGSFLRNLVKGPFPFHVSSQLIAAWCLPASPEPLFFS